MKAWSFYKLDTGEFTGTRLRASQRHLANNTPAGLGVIEGAYDHRTQRVDLTSGAVVGRIRSSAEIETEAREAQHERTMREIASVEGRTQRAVRELLVDAIASGHVDMNAEAARRVIEADQRISKLREKL